MKALTALLAILLVLGLLAGLGFGGYLLLKVTLARFAGLDPQVATVTVASLVTLLIAAGIIGGAIRCARRMDGVYRLQAQRATVYQDFLQQWLGLQQQARDHQLQPGRASQVLSELNYSLALWSSKALLEGWWELSRLARSGAWQDPGLGSCFQKVLLQMRLDLGVSNRRLSRGIMLDLLTGDGGAGSAGHHSNGNSNASQRYPVTH